MITQTSKFSVLARRINRLRHQPQPGKQWNILYKLFALTITLSLLAGGFLSPTGQTQSAQAQAASGYLRTSGTRIVDANGSTVAFSGLNWFGFETSNFAPHGIWQRSYKEMLDQIKSLGYNSLRIPFANAMFNSGAQVSGIDFNKNPDLVGLSPIQVMDKFIEAAGARNIRIILTNHRSSPGGGPEENGLWYTSAYPESRWIDDWKMLANRYKGNPTVVGMDLRNEPWNACWGCGNQGTDWRLAAERAGNAILAINPDLLIVVEGVAVHGGHHGWWGGNLIGAKAHPVRLNVPNRLVYSPHDYPESVYPMPWFSDPNYPNNLPAVWELYWGYLITENIAPVLIGEFGTKYQSTKDKQWLSSLQTYIKNRGLSWTFWSLNPNSTDTGGLLLDDWVTVHKEKQAVLAAIQYPFIGSGSQSPSPTPAKTSTPPPVPTATPPSAPTPTPPSGSSYVLDDFESGSLNKWSTFAGPNSSISPSRFSPGQAGQYAMQVNYSVGSSSWAGIQQIYSPPADWSSYQIFSFGFFGRSSGNRIRLEVLENKAPNTSGDTSERFEYIFTDNFSGWRTFSVPFSSFTRRSDYQPSGAPNDGFNRSQVWGFNFAPMSGKNNFALDQVKLER